MEPQEDKNHSDPGNSDLVIPPMTEFSDTDQTQTVNDDNKPSKISNWKLITGYIVFPIRYLLSHETLLLTFVTIALVWVNYWMFRDSHNQIEESKKMVRATQDMVEATKKSVAIAETTTTIAKNGLKIEQEGMYAANTPYISISVPTADMRIMKGGRFTVIVRYLNVGKTPALDFRALPIIRTEGQHAPIDSEKPINEKIMTGKPILMPNDFFTKEFVSHVLDDNEVNRINNGIIVIYICSVVNYRDIFGHRFQVTQRLWWDGKTFSPDDYGNEYKKY